MIRLAGDAPVHIHLAEQAKEVEDCLNWCGHRPATWLLDSFDVNDQWCLVHATHVDHRELERIAASGATVGLCPITEANLGDGIFPAAQFLALSGSYAIGSDSNVLIDAAEELRVLEYTQRLALSRPQRHGAQRWSLNRAITFRVGAPWRFSSAGNSERRNPHPGCRRPDRPRRESRRSGGPIGRCGP